jgi:hypothetical protein
MQLTPLTLSKVTLLSLTCTLLLACAAAPSQGVLEGTSRTNKTFVAGVPGGSYSETERISATVSAIDYSSRSVTLKDTQGNTRTVIAGAEVNNLQLVKVGDWVNITATVETVVYLQARGQHATDGAAAMALSGKASHVGMLTAATEQYTAVVSAVNPAQQQVTLQYADNSSKTLAVRNDIVLSSEYVGKHVVFDVTRVMAVTVEKP